MSVSALALIMNAVVSAAPADLTPTALATKGREIDLGNAPYNWHSQQSGMTSLQLATNTATCDTVTGHTNNGRDTVPDCRFD
jgi:hypothetical protein